MTTTFNLKRLLDRKQWEPCAPSPVATSIGSFIVSSNLKDQYQYFITSNTTGYVYDPYEDGWMNMPSPAFVGTFGAGSSGQRHPWGPRGFPTAGTTSTITTNLNIQRDLRGYDIRIIAGPNAGQVRTIASNTIGTNSVITVTTPYSAAITTASEYILITGRVWCINGASTAAGSFKYYDLATNTWNNAGAAAPVSLGTDSKLVVTPGLLTDFEARTATSATSTTLVDSTQTWAVNNWTNSQIRIVSGTGAGQFRTVASNTATAVTVSAAWTTIPDATSTYVIEGNSDHIYLLGNNAVTMYRYSISSGIWTTLAPTTARSGTPVAGMTAHWVWDVTDAAWKDPATSAPMNGKYIYSFRGSGSAIVDRYNIATNAWENDIAYSSKSELLATTNQSVYAKNYIYINLGATGRWIKFNLVENRMEPFSQLWYTQSTAHLGDRAFDVDYTDGDTTLKFIYTMTNNQQMLFRTLVF